MKIGIVGTGYVGLVTGSCFADMGNDVICQDIDPVKIDGLCKGKAPFFEPGLDALLEKNIIEKRLSFTTNTQEIASQHVIFFCVGTPSNDQGDADLTALYAALDSMIAAINGARIFVLKSTVPVGTAARIKTYLSQKTSLAIALVSNPEFLKQGDAVHDFMKPDRVVIGTEDSTAGDTVEALYKPFVRTGKPIIRMDHASAELMKYAANTLLATRVTLMNQIANLCDKVGADVEKVRLALGADQRIGARFLFPGVGWGGSCFGKDMRALSYLGRKVDAPISMAEEALRSNVKQPFVVVEKLLVSLDSLQGKTIALWGLSFKPGTDDVRDAPSLTIAKELLAKGASLRVYDPKANDNFSQALDTSQNVFLAEHAYQALEGADALVLITEWSAFRNPDFEKVRALLKQAIIVDGRNQYDPEHLLGLGFLYSGIGRA